VVGDVGDGKEQRNRDSQCACWECDRQADEAVIHVPTLSARIMYELL